MTNVLEKNKGYIVLLEHKLWMNVKGIEYFSDLGEIKFRDYEVTLIPFERTPEGFKIKIGDLEQIIEYKVKK